MARECSVAGCEREHRAKGLCSTHYERARQYGSTAERRPVNRNTVISTPRQGVPTISDEARRRGEVRRAIEDKEAELHLLRMLADDDW